MADVIDEQIEIGLAGRAAAHQLARRLGALRTLEHALGSRLFGTPRGESANPAGQALTYPRGSQTHPAAWKLKQVRVIQQPIVQRRARLLHALAVARRHCLAHLPAQVLDRKSTRLNSS